MILNYTTKITTEKTAGEIQYKLSKAKAQAVLFEYDKDGIMCSISFSVITAHGSVFFKLPTNTQGVYKALQSKKIPKKLRTKEQAARVAWRILKNWVEAQLAIVEAEMAEMTEVFLPYARNENGKTMYETINENKFRLLIHENSTNRQKP